MTTAISTFKLNNVEYLQNPLSTADKVSKTKLIAVTYTPELLQRESSTNIRLLATGIVPTSERIDGKLKRLDKSGLTKHLINATEDYRTASRLEAANLIRQASSNLFSQGINPEMLDNFFSDYKHDSHEAATVLFGYLKTKYKDSTVVKTHQPEILKWLTAHPSIDPEYASSFSKVFRQLTRPLGASVDSATDALVTDNRTNRQMLNSKPLREWMTAQVLKLRVNNGVGKWEEIAYLIALATGRRCGEILGGKSTYEIKDEYSMYFSGQLKQRIAEGEPDLTFEIPTLIPTADVVWLLSLIEHKRIRPEAGEDLGSIVNKKYGASLSREITPKFKTDLRVLSQGAITKFKDSRLFYAAEVTREYERLLYKPMAYDLYLSSVLGHWCSGEQSNSYRNYQQLCTYQD